MKQALAIGIENYKEMIDKDYCYVDKTLFIKELLRQKGKVNLFTRPRRFGKTLALSMIKTFFEKEIDKNGESVDKTPYFTGKNIMNAGNEYTQLLGRYPVIFLTLKSAKQPDFYLAYEMIKRQIMREYDRHSYVLSCNFLNPEQRNRFEQILNGEPDPSLYMDSLLFLSECLKKYHHENVIILLDEYDVPLENAYFEGFYEKMSGFIRSLFESALKTNDNLEFAVITGCLRISKESIFTGLNNLEINSLLSNDYAEYFGFTYEEVNQLLNYYELEQETDTIKQWYDGYRFGNTKVYNPWSLLNYIKAISIKGETYPKPYWSNTSSNSIIHELVDQADNTVKQELEILIAGGSIKKPVHEDITYEDIHQSSENLWNFLFFTGYLTMTEVHFFDDSIYLNLVIPNAEIRYIYRHTVREWFESCVRHTDYDNFYHALLSENAEEMEDFISNQLIKSISYYDNKESFYHGYLAGILGGLSGYQLDSNQESGQGRPDILLLPFQPKKPAILIEIKQTGNYTKMEQLCQNALKQIKEKQYAAPLLAKGYQHIISYGICFCQKAAMVKCAIRNE
ncbi:MAG: AAA family ATPase [Lachnospiraceae bacterium]|nr:AAA family ATPase [Lachnospiraceae bacterium]